MKVSFAIYDDTQLLLEKKTDKCKNYSEMSSTTKIDKCTKCDCSLFTQSSFHNNGSKHGYYRDNDCMKNFCKYLREHLMKITNSERLKILPLTEKEDKSHTSKISVIYVKVNLIVTLKLIVKFEIMIIILEILGVLHILYAI